MHSVAISDSHRAIERKRCAFCDQKRNTAAHCVSRLDDQTIVVACIGECHASISSIGSFQDIIDEHH